jgi:hypothetical protein
MITLCNFASFVTIVMTGGVMICGALWLREHDESSS